MMYKTFTVLFKNIPASQILGYLKQINDFELLWKTAQNVTT